MIPYIEIASKTFDSASIDLTALTSEGGAWNSLQGYTGADYVAFFNTTLATRKYQGGEQLQQVLFNDSGTAPTLGANTYRMITWNANDGGGSGNPGQDGSRVVSIPVGQANSGIKFTLVAERGKRKRFTWYGRTYNGTYVAKGTLSDGGVTPPTLTLTNEPGHGWFTVDFHGASSDSTIEIEVRRTVADGSEGYVLSQAATLDIPTLAPKPGGLKKYMQWRALWGGANA